MRRGNNLLITDAVYDPKSSFCDGFLALLGVKKMYLSPTTSDDNFAALIRPNTKVVLV